MLSKNNTDLYSAKLAPKHQKFAIKKFTVGVASVLIGTTFAFYTAPNVLADLSDAQSDPVTTKDQTNASASKEQASRKDATSSVDKTPAEQAPVVKQPTEPEQTSQTPSQDASHVTDMAQLKTALNDRNVAEIVLDKDVTNDTDKYVNVDQAKVARKVTVWGSKVADKTTTLNLGDQSLYFYNKTEDDEHKWDLTFKNLNVMTNDPHGYGVVSFQNNGKNANVTFDNVKAGGNGVLAYAPNATVNLHDVSVTPSYAESSPTANLTADKVDLSGNVDLNAEVNNSYTAKNVEAGGQVTVKSGANVVLTATNSISNRLQNLTAGSLNVEKGAKLTVRSKTTASNIKVPSSVSWSGLVDNSSAVYVTKGNAKVDGELKVEPFTKDKKSTSVVGAVVLGASGNEENNLVVGSTGKLIVDATQSPNTRGVYFTHNNHDFGLQTGGQAIFKMGHGVSNAIFNPDNLILNEGSKLVVETYQDNNGVTNVGFDDTGAGAHSGVITLNLNSSDHSNNSYVTVGNIHGNLTVKQDALLKVVRKVDETSQQAATPVLSFGGTGINNGTSILNVDHGSVVLEDALQKDSLAHSNLNYYSYLGINNNEHSPIYPLGMVSMWGTSSTDRVNLVAPKLFKMVRTGEQKGMLFRLEAEDNKIMLTTDEGKSVPVKYGTLGNVKYNNGLVSQAKDYQWDLTYLKSVNWLGDFSMNYLNKNQTGTPFGLSPTASVSFKQETPQAAKDDFNNYFNWWSSTNLELGTDLNGFHPFYRPLVVLQNEVQSEKVSYPEHENPGDVTYKVGATDGDWVKVDATGTLSVTPNATTSVGMHNVPVEVSFASGQKVVVYAPVTVLDSNSKAVFNGENVLLGEGRPVFTHKASNKALVPAPMQALNKLVVYTKDLKTGKYLPNAVYVPDKAGEFTDEATGKALVGVKVTWKQVPSPLVAQDSSNTGTESLPAVVNVANDLVDFPKGGRFPDLGELPVMMTMYGASAKNDAQATSGLEKTLPNASDVVQTEELTPAHHAEVASVAWKTKPELTRPDRQAKGVVSVDFVDGTILNVPVLVNVVPNMAESNTPQGQELTTPLNQVPEAQRGISNTSELPTDTKYSWKAPLDVTIPGTRQATVVVTYPDGSQDEVPVKVVVKAPEKVPTDAEKYTPQSQEVTTAQGKAPEAQAGVSNKGDLPTDTKYSWKAPLDVETPGQHQGTVVVTYPDGSQDEVPVKVVVKAPADAEKYTPQGQEVETAQGKAPEAQAGVSNKADLPTDTKYSWKAPLDVETPGEHEETVVVTYPDGSQDEVPVKVVVKAPTDAEKYTPQGQEVETAQGKTPEAQAGVSNKADLPTATKYSWKAPLDVTTPGKHEGTVVVTYPDGSQDEVPVKVVVKAPEKVPTDAEKYTPQGQEVETAQGKTPEAQAGVSNKADLPTATKYSWKAPLDVETPGEHEGTVVVTYPDGSQDEVPVKVMVKAPEKVPTDAEKYTPQGQEVGTAQGKTPEAQAGVSNKSDLPAGTKYSWKAPLDVETPGENEGTVVVTYPDGSQDEVPVKVMVKAPTDAEKYTPQGQEVETAQGKTPEAQAGVSNKGDLPTDTKYSWKAPLDVETPGEHEGTVVVTYPDGSQDEVPVKVMVKAPEKVPTDAEKYTPQGQEVETAQGKTPEAQAGVSNKVDLPAGTKYSWKAPLDVETPGENEGTVVVTYPDGSQDEVPVKVMVKAPEKVPTDAEKYTPQGQEVETAQGKQPEAQAGVSNKVDLPADTKYSWKAPLDVETPGEREGTVVVTYPDGSQDEVPVKVVVKAPEKALTDAEKYTPQGQEVGTAQGKTPEAQAGVSNKVDLPADTKYSWKAPLDVETPGKHTGTVVVTYPDGSQDEVPVKVVVKAPTDAEKYTPQGQEVETAQGKTPEAQAGVSNKSDLPADTKYSWKAPLDVETPGEHTDTVVVTYPDGSQDEVPVKVVVKAPEKSLTDAEKYTPQSQEVTTAQGKNPEAESVVTNKSDLPTGTKYSWKAPLDVMTPGEHEEKVVVTYPDGSQDEVPVKVVVKVPEKSLTDAEKYTPQSQEVTTAQGKTPEAESVVTNKSDLPTGTKYSWKAPLDVETPGEHEGTVVVTYPDGSQEEVPVKVVVKAPTDAEKYTPQGQEVETAQGKQPEAQAGVSNKGDLPTGTKYSWKAPLDVATPETHAGTVVVTYPDGSQEEVPVKVVVKAPEKALTDAEKYTPQSQEVTTNTGKIPEAESVVTNKSDLPAGTKYSWKAPLDVTTPGSHAGTVVVTYPDGSQDEVPVKVVVKAPEKALTDAEKYTPQGQEVETAYGKTPEAESVVTNKADLPAGTKYSWKAPLDVETPGEHEGTVVVTYPDGSQEEVPVKVVVKAPTDAEKYTPQSQEVTTNTGKIPEAESVVTNKSDLPAGTKYSWKAPLDVTTPGSHAGTVAVTYPDGSQDEVPVKVVVKAPEKTVTDADKYTPQSQEVTTTQGKTPEAQAGVFNKVDLPAGTKYSWKAPLDVMTPGVHEGTVAVTYPDGSQDEVPVKVEVKAPKKALTDAEKYKPQGQKVTTAQGKQPEAQTGVSNKADLPADTKYSWKTPLDVTTPGEHGGTVVVTYPDGSQDEVPVKVVVDGAGTTADKRKEQTQTKGTNKNALPQTGEKDTVVQAWFGVLISLLVGMLGAKTLNKKHFQDK
ncbi:YSIRK-type signal peptide-containing protein [Ligilactobacillus murinus]|uniref:Rib/alpha-like domain-containing protein n=1 Tax=Ligilactobacillus murinus TaxID=1622 RepID=UPI001C8B903F|nr:Rib/alpha-like domain-containing protein [Ligilactobacillus murinus]MBX9013226.1 YSIRK-type signal peptide-containing protein [Ligilactobacillus murinus]